MPKRTQPERGAKSKVTKETKETKPAKGSKGSKGTKTPKENGNTKAVKEEILKAVEEPAKKEKILTNSSLDQLKQVNTESSVFSALL